MHSQRIFATEGVDRIALSCHGRRIFRRASESHLLIGRYRAQAIAANAFPKLVSAELLQVSLILSKAMRCPYIYNVIHGGFCGAMSVATTF